MSLNIWLTQGEEEDVLGELDSILAELEGEALPRCNIHILKLIKASILKHRDMMIASLPSVPTANVEREGEELELPAVPDHQPQVDQVY